MTAGYAFPMKIRAALATPLVAAALITAGCSADDATDAVKSTAGKVSAAAGERLSAACRDAKAAVADLTTKAGNTLPAGLTQADRALDSVAQALKDIQVPESVKSTIEGATSQMGAAGDAVAKAVDSAGQSASGQAAKDATAAAATRAEALAASLKEATSSLGLSC